jgi:hypothetical protein
MAMDSKSLLRVRVTEELTRPEGGSEIKSRAGQRTGRADHRRKVESKATWGGGRRDPVTPKTRYDEIRTSSFTSRSITEVQHVRR